MAYRNVSDEVLELAPGDRRELCFSFDDLLEDGEEIIYCNTSHAEGPATIFGAEHWMTDGRRVYYCYHSATKLGYYEVGWWVKTMKAGATYRELERTWFVQVKEM